jgi:anthranilate synthase/indole-3-glycerol phosphate synthase/phosphoribosylanthranilate isomerase
VEVNTAEEMTIAVKLGSKVIGVNNRNLASFEVDLDTTSRLLSQVPKETIVCALSGISGPKDVEAYQKNGVGAVLVGEALMRAKDTAQFIRELLSAPAQVKIEPGRLLVKICGTRRPETALEAIKAGADLIGIILVPGRTRHVPYNDAIAISKVVHQSVSSSGRVAPDRPSNLATDFFAHAGSNIASHRPLLVGVFRNQPLEEVLELQKAYDLDIVQLHGDEPLEWANLIPVPVIRSFSPGQAGLRRRGYHTIPLLDSGIGGTGERLDLGSVKAVLENDEGLNVLLAGGLDPSNVAEAVKSIGELGSRVVGVDVSSGVEEDGVQSVERIQAFIKAARSVR